MVNRSALEAVRNGIWKLQQDAVMPDRQRQDLILHLMGHVVDLIEAIDSSYVWCSKPDRKNGIPNESAQD